MRRFHPLRPNHHHFWRLSGLHQRRHDHQGCRNQASNIRVGDVNFKDEYEKTDVHVKVYFADGFKKHDSNIALIATNETIEFNDETVMPIGLPEEDFRIERRAADLAMWNDEGVLEEDVKVRESKKGCDFVDKTDDLQHCANMKTCKGSGASMVRREGPILIGILGKDPNCENEVDKDNGKFQRKFAKVAHPEVLKFIKDSKKGLKTQLKTRLKRLSV